MMSRLFTQRKSTTVGTERNLLAKARTVQLAPAQTLPEVDFRFRAILP
jgi:hypothetical protein